MDYELSIDLPNRLHMSLKNGEWSDCSFTVGTEPDVKVFNAHKMMLSAASPVFRAMFTGDLAEKNPVKITDIKPEVFESVLIFIYTDQANMRTIRQTGDVWYAAEKYMITKLVDECEKFMLKFLNYANACQVFEIVKQFDRLNVLHRSLEIITQETYNVLKNSSFEEVQLSTFLKILDSDKLTLYTHPLVYDESDTSLFDAAIRWGIAECKRKEIPADMPNVRKVIAPALRKIRFLNFSAKQFNTSMEKWNILTDDERSKILSNITDKTAFPLMPEGFSPSQVPRQPN